MLIFWDLILRSIERILSILVVGYVVLTYFSAETNPVRVALGKIIEPILEKIRKVVPAIKGIDFSPLILLLFIQLIYILGHQLIRMAFAP